MGVGLLTVPASIQPVKESPVGVEYSDYTWFAEMNGYWEEKKMEGMGIIMFLIIGGLAGFIAGKIMKGGGFGLVGNVVVGVIGAFVGGFLFNILGLSAGGVVGSLIMAVIGAVVLLYVVGLVKKA